MRNIGITVVSCTSQLGSVTDVCFFFDLIKHFVVNKYPDQDWSLLTDRLYKRYLKFEELEPAAALMAQVKQVFAALPRDSVDFEGYEESKATKNNQLDSTKATLADIFEDFFVVFNEACEELKYYYEKYPDETWYHALPLRFVITDLIPCSRERDRPLAEYDALEDKPFWLQANPSYDFEKPLNS
jgi:hypothetical protein